MRSHILMPSTYWDVSHRRSSTSMFRCWPDLGRETHLFCHQATSGLRRRWPGAIHAVTPPAAPDPLVALLDRRVPAAWFDRRLRARLLRRVRAGEVVVCWPGTSAETIRALKAHGAVVAVEFINTHCQYSFRILQREYARLGLVYGGRITPEAVAADDMRIREADLIFCPNAFVEESVREAADERGGPGAERIEGKILSSSRGTFLRPGQEPRAAPEGAFTFVFVGEFGVRKGAADIVRAMKRTGEGVRLLVAGQVAADFRGWLEGEGLPGNVELLGFVGDMDAVYARADALLFPSLEEGGPKVCYEAAAHALPMVATAIGGGRIVREGETGLLVPPADPDALAEAIGRMAGDAAAYERMSRGALAAVERFSWEAIARDRHAQLLARGL